MGQRYRPAARKETGKVKGVAGVPSGGSVTPTAAALDCPGIDPGDRTHVLVRRGRPTPRCGGRVTSEGPATQSASLTARGGFASVSPVVFIQHTLTRQYLQGYAEWSLDWDEAWPFAGVAEALKFCDLWRLEDVQIIVPTDQDVHRFSVTGGAREVPAPNTVPVILPLVDLRPN